MGYRIQNRRDTAARWAEMNPILLEGEMGIVLDDPNQYKIGDGVHTWNELPLRGFTGTIAQTLGNNENAVASQKVVTEKFAEQDEKLSDIGSKVDGLGISLKGDVVDIELMADNTTHILPFAFKSGVSFQIKWVSGRYWDYGARLVFYNGDFVVHDTGDSYSRSEFEKVFTFDSDVTKITFTLKSKTAFECVFQMTNVLSIGLGKLKERVEYNASFVDYNTNIDFPSLWGIGSTENGTGNYQPSEKRRIALVGIIRINKDISLKAKDGFRFAYWKFTDESGNGGVDSGWMSEAVLRKGEFVRMQIARKTEISGEVANVDEFLGGVAFIDATIGEDMTEIRNAINESNKRVDELEDKFGDILLTPINGYIMDDKTWGGVDSSNRQHIVIHISEGDYIKLVGNDIHNDYVCFLSDYAIESGASANVIGKINTVPISTEVSFEAPSGAKYLYLQYNSFGTIYLCSSIAINGFDYQKDIAENIKHIAEKVDNINASSVGKFERIIGEDFNVKTRIENLKLCNMVQRGKNNTDGGTLFTMLHFSDNHNCADNLALYDELMTRYDAYIDAALNTGDLTGGTISTVVTGYEKYAQKFMLAVGNHDAASYKDGSYYMASSERVYDKFLADYVSVWGVTLGGTKKNYYYKDFPSEENGVNGIRLIVLDNYNNNQDGVYTQDEVLNIDQSEQVTWLQYVLETARQNNLSVICAHHEPVYRHSRGWVNAWSFRDAQKAIGSEKRFAESIKSFIDNGGDFVCWLSGHLHRDDINAIESDSRQIDMNINCSGYTNLTSEDGAMIKDTPSQVCANLIAVDTKAKQIKVMRVGRNMNRYLEFKNSIIINYGSNPSVITSN